MKVTDKLDRVKSGVGGVKTRSLVVVTLVIVIIVAFIAWTALRDTQGILEDTSKTKRVKPMVNLPGAGEASVVYDPLQKQQNEEEAKAALKSGQSAVPSLINQGGEGYNRGGFGNLGDNTGRCGDECYDRSGYDSQGFDRNGFGKDGFDRNGYDKDGYDRDGFDRQGYDRDGFNKKGCNRQGLNREGKPCAESNFGADCFNELGKDKNGCNKEGKDDHGAVCYNAQGFNKAGFNKCGLDVNGFDASGHDCNGCDKLGKDPKGKVCYDATGFNDKGLDKFCRDREGFDKAGFDKNGFDRNGFDKDGYGRDGFNKNGCNREGKNREGRPCYNAEGRTEAGFDKQGFDPHGFGHDGFDRQGYDKNGYDANGYDRMGFDKDGCNKEGKNHQGKPCKGGAENDLGNLLGPNANPEGAGGAPATAQAQAAAQYKRLMEDQRALQQQQMAALTAQQQAELAAKQQQQIAAAEALMSTQAQALIQAWGPPTQSYVKGSKNTEKPAAAVPEKKPGALPAYGTGPIIQRAGDVVFAVIDTSINSDEPGPVLARIVSGPLKGSKILGTFERQDKSLLLTFTTLSMPDVPQSISMEAIAIDPETARTAMASDVDNHYLTKYGSLLASSFLQGMGQAVETSIGTPQLSSQGAATIATTTAATTQDQIIVGLGKVGTQIATDINQANIQPTVTLNQGTGVGLLFMSDLRVEAPPEKPTATPDFGTTTSGGVASNLQPPAPPPSAGGSQTITITTNPSGTTGTTGTTGSTGTGTGTGSGSTGGSSGTGSTGGSVTPTQ